MRVQRTLGSAGTFAALLVLQFMICTTSQAQNNVLFVPVASGDAMSAPSKQRSEAIAKAATTRAMDLVRVNIAALEGASAVIPLPELGAMRADRRKTNVRSPRDYTWIGEMQVTGGSVLLVVQDGQVTGSIRSGLDQFSVTPIGDGVHAIVKIDHGQFPPAHPPGPPPRAPAEPRNSTPAPQPEAPQRQRGDASNGDAPAAGILVDIMITWTNEAAAAYGGSMPALAQLAIDLANIAYTNSNANVELRLVSAVAANYSEAGQTFNALLDALTSGSAFAAIRGTRDSVGADAVGLFVANGQYCGLGWLNSTAAYAFSATNYGCVDNQTFAHELGHNFGAHHDPFVTNPSESPYPYGHGYVVPSNAWRTIMAYVDACGSCPKIPHFSNPSVLYQGTPTGTAATHDNARVHRERVATVAAFRSPPATPTLAVTPPGNFSSSGNVGGPFSPASTTYAVQNSGGGTMTWSASSSNANVANVSPASGTLAAGASANVTVSIVPGATGLSAGTYSSTISFTNATNGNGNTTRTATLTVNSPGGGGFCTDAFAGAPILPGSSGSVSGSTTTATGESGEPDHAGVSVPLNSVWCRFTAAATGTATFTTVGSNYDTTLAAYTGSSVNALSVVASNDDFGAPGVRTSQISFTATAGTTYRIAVDGFSANTGNYTLNYTLPTGGGGGGTARFDFNGDGTSDILWYNASNRGVGMFRMQNGVPTWVGIGQGGSGWSIVGVGDFNGDGTSDILWYNASSRGVGMFRMVNGAATWVGIGTGGAGWSIVGTGDYNGDGTADILWYHASSRSVGMFRMSNGAATWVNIGTGGAGWSIVGSGDFNGDGTTDILWYHASSRSVGQFRMSNGVPTWASIGAGGAGWSIMGTGDFNGDGTSDILWYHASSRAVGQFRMSNGAATWASIGTGGAGWSVAGTGDYNGDGTADILWYHASSRSVGQFRMSNGVPTWASIGTGGAGWVIEGDSAIVGHPAGIASASQ